MLLKLLVKQLVKLISVTIGGAMVGEFPLSFRQQLALVIYLLPVVKRPPPCPLPTTPIFFPHIV